MGAEPAKARGSRHPLVEKILEGSAPEALRQAAARGAMPIPLHDLVYAQICLLQDGVPAVAQAAVASLAAISEGNLLSLFRDPGCEPVILDHFARGGRLSGQALETAVAHPSIPDAALETLAAEAASDTLNLIVTNEVRIIGNPRLLGLLRANPNLSADNRRRLLELERDFVGKEAIEVRRPQPEAIPLPEAPPEGVEAPPEEPPPIMTPEQEKEFEEALRRTPTFQRVAKLNVAEKVQLAMKGNAEERAILIRDSAKMVSMQVLKSPKLSDNEIISFANMRSIHEDVLRVIAGSREWTKAYSVAHALVRNPKTPAGLTVQFLPRLGTRDLKIVQGDKNVPELVRRQARNLFLQRTQPPKKLGKKAH